MKLLALFLLMFSTSLFAAPATEETLLLINENLINIDASLDQLLEILAVGFLFIGVCLGFISGQQR